MDDLVTAVLGAVEQATARGDDLTRAALGAAGWAQGNDVVAGLIEQRLLDGVAERGPDGTARTVSVRALSQSGRERLLEQVPAELSVRSRQALVAFARPHDAIDDPVTGGAVPESVMAELLTRGLLLPGASHALSPLGTAVLARLQSGQARGDVTIFGNVSGSQVAGPGSVISGTVQNTDPAMAQLAEVIAQVLARLDDLPLEAEQAAEVKADLETARAQALSPKPRRRIISECLSSARSMLENVNSTYAGLLELLGHLHL